MSTDELVFLHFNDVYHIGKPEIIAQFLTQLRAWREEYAEEQPITVFSGDVFSPSLEASVLTGSHMIPLLNALGVNVGCYGNHDFDFGEERLRELAGQTRFPWLLSNALRIRQSDVQSCLDSSGNLREDDLLANARMFHTITVLGYKIGFFGLAGTDWPSNCRELPPCSIVSPVETARAVSRHLRMIEKCDLVVANTHMRLTEDIEVSEALKEPHDEARVDLLLGGHDHDILRRHAGSKMADSEVVDVNMSNDEAVIREKGLVRDDKGNIRIVKSGTDWKSLSCVRLQVSRSADGSAHLHQVILQQVSDVSKINHVPDALEASRAVIQGCLKGVNDHFDALGSQALLLSTVPLEGTGSLVRSQETNLCNMLADMVRAYYEVDIAFVNSGGVRCDRLIPPTLKGKALTVRDIIDIVPFNNAFMVKRVPSPVLIDALENSVSDAHTDGRFMQFSGLSLVACWSNIEGSRVLEVYYHPHNALDASSIPIRITRSSPQIFDVAMVAFIAEGFDGYVGFKDCETIVAEEGAMTDTEMFLRILGYTPQDGSAKDREDNAEEEERIGNARKAVITEWDRETGLPVVSPRIEDRIRFVDKGHKSQRV